MHIYVHYINLTVCFKIFGSILIFFLKIFNKYSIKIYTNFILFKFLSFFYSQQHRNLIPKSKYTLLILNNGNIQMVVLNVTITFLDNEIVKVINLQLSNKCFKIQSILNSLNI